MDEAVLCALQQQCALSLATHHFHLETYSNRFFWGRIYGVDRTRGGVFTV